MNGLNRIVWVGALALALSVVPLFARSAAAAPIVTSGRPQSPAIAQSCCDGSYLLVWAEDRGTGTGLDLYGARANSAGIVAGTEMPIVIAAGNQSDPTMAFSRRNNSYLLIYTTDGVPAQPIVTPGIPTPPGMPTPPVPPGFPTPRPIGPVDASVTGFDQIPPPPPPPGATATVPSLPTPGVPPGTPGPGPTPDPNGPPAPPTASGARDLYGVWLSPSGNRVTQIFAVVTSPADDTYPDLGYVLRNGTDEFALTWREVTGINAAIVVMRLQGIGYYFAVNNKATVIAGGDLGRPSVAGEHTEGSYFLVWAQTPTDSPARNVYGRKLNANAWPIGPVREVVTGPADQVYPSIASLGDHGGHLVAWEERMPGQAPDIRMRRLNRNGIPIGAAYNLAGGAPFSFAPDLASTWLSSTLVVWVDRNAASDHSILGAAVNLDGRRMGPERLIVQGGTGPGAVTPGVPPPGLPTPPLPPGFPTAPVPPGPPGLPTPGPFPTATP